MLDYCFTLHVLIQPSKCLQGGANDQQKCVHSRVKKQNITYWLKREFLQNFKVKNYAAGAHEQELAYLIHALMSQPVRVSFYF